MDLEPSGIYCEHCWHSYKFNDKAAVIAAYFNETLRLQCDDCGNSMDLWNATLKSIKKAELTMIEEHCVALEARRSIVETQLPASQITEVVFADTGIPTDAIILNINYNATLKGEVLGGSGGSIQPVEIYSNPLVRRINPLKVSFYGVPHGEPPFPETYLTMGVTWIPNKPNDIAWEFLLNAFLYYIDDRYHGAVLAANASVETLLGTLMFNFLRGKASNDNVEQFLKNGATYSHQLNILLPAFLSGTDIPLLPERIRGALNGLRKLRNDLAHGTVPPQSITPDRAAEALCAAVFGNYYINFAGPLLRAAHGRA